MNILYKLHSGKNNKLAYYARNYLAMLVPDGLYRARLERVLADLTAEERLIVEERAAYYCKPFDIGLPEETPRLADHKLKNRRYPSVYFFDSRQWLRWFPKSLHWAYEFGDVTEVPQLPSIVKSRPIGDDNARAVLLNLDKVRHFVFLNDRTPFTAKEDKVIFRGDIGSKEHRRRFVEMYYDAEFCDAGDTSPSVIRERFGIPEEWHREPISLYEHLRFKFIMALEGYDVASNLKWVMSSNSLAVMPKPKYETWFMEGLLQPGVHYVEIAADFSDLKEKMEWYAARPEEAERIIANAHAHVARFRNPRIERAAALMVLLRYFGQTGQL